MEGSLPQRKTTAQKAGEPARIPTHQLVYHQLRDAVLFGELAPGEPVTIQGLIERTGAGMTPIREAIRRLTSEGALEFRGNRRVLVPMPTPEAIEELIFLRETLEPQLAARAATRASDADIQELKRIDSALDEAITRGDVATYLRQNHAFHTKLYTVAEAPILSEVVGGVWLRFGPAMRVVCGRMGTQNLPDNHKTALAALAAKDSTAAAEAMRLDVVQGMEQLLEALKDAESFADAID
ncbi:DNA-binding GntR family transcriptional regulator [Shimia isoporae]|uniref:DNA-binding GntR family transcriptional regulator n=1 Tax=Shimia isoporae TaxID=647720 RepID=A0A4R1NBI0_9RHOB|nr:GntR family transcriptional regulator [Shimia isoporae]TCL01469.1 DNA-binding GntR family transcriptional regulator [Shimia isoporae]